MIVFPTSAAEAAAARGVLRAGGTDVLPSARDGLRQGDIVDLRDVAGLDLIRAGATGELEIGARVTLAAIAEHPEIRGRWPALAAAASAAGTPQIRARATVAGNLLQEVRCVYYRTASFACSKKGGAKCFARDPEADAERHAVLENGPCIAVHPSSLAVALLVYGAVVRVHGAAGRDVAALLGDGGDPLRTHALRPGQVVTAIAVPATLPGERAGYARIQASEQAGWPLIEAAVRMHLDSRGHIEGFAFAVNGIGNRPLEWPQASRAAVGLEPHDPRLDALFAGLLPRFLPIRSAAYKANLLPVVLRDAVDRALGRQVFSVGGG